MRSTSGVTTLSKGKCWCGKGRWLQVDPEAEKFYPLSPYNSMGNNPVSMVDPDGDEPITAMLLGAAIGVISNGISNLSQGNNFFQGGLKAAAFGAIGGAFASGIGQAANQITNGFAKGAFQTIAHGHTSGVMSGIQGGSYGSGFASGGFSSGMSSIASAMKVGNVGMIGVGGLSGGVGSHLAGGDFWTGVGQGVITSGLNHAAHSGMFGDNLAAALWTGRTRHLLGPDALSAEIFGNAGLFPSIEGGLGGLLVLRGKDIGYATGIFDAGVGAGLEFGAGFSLTKLYHTGPETAIRATDFLGTRLSGTVSLNLAGLDVGVKVSYAKIKRNEILGLGRTLGVGTGAPFGTFGISGNINYGKTMTTRDLLELIK